MADNEQSEAIRQARLAEIEKRPNLYDEYDAELQADVEFPGGLTLTLLSDLHPRMKSLKARQMKKYRHHFNSGDVPEKTETQIEMEKIGAAVVGWKGATGRDGKELPFTPDNLQTLMTDLPHLRKDALYAVAVRETFRKEAQAALGEGSAPASAQT